MLAEVKNLCKSYETRDGKGVLALDNISFQIEEKEFVSIVGPSGCGKSTFLKILAGIIPLSSGEILLQGTPVDGPRKDIGVVFQAPVLLPWRSVLQNILVPVEIQKRDKVSHTKTAIELLELVGLKGFENKYAFELSGGMQQRVGIGRALVCNPSILLMDEPFAALDAMTRENMNMELLRIWRESKKTVVFVTHSIPEAVLLSDRVIVLTERPGRLAEIIKIDIPRPRSIDMISTDEFGLFEKKVRELMEGLED
jgi:NitT/TauT family transport system ATP-binding protein